MAYPLFHPRSQDERPRNLTVEDFTEAFVAESEFVEFKEGAGGKGIVDAAVAFSNSDGGVLLLGVTDRGEVKGMGLSGEGEAKLHGSLSDAHNLGRYDVCRVGVGDRSVVILAVHRRIEGYAQTSDGRVLVRLGASNRALIGLDLSEFIARRSLTRFEATPTEISLDSVDGALLSELAESWSWSDEVARPPDGRPIDDQLISRLGERRLIESTISGVRLTVAGALYLLREPHHALGKAYVEIFRYRDDGPDYDRRVEVVGPLQEQVRNATSFIVDEIGRELVVLGVRRHELPRLPEVVVREAIANAVAHRKYDMSGQAVRVELRPDRVVVTSPGGLPEPVTVESIREQNSPRNVAVIATLRRFGLAEDAGRGVDVMQDEMASNLLEPPEFVEIDGRDSLRVTLPLTATVTLEERAWVRELEKCGSLQAKDPLLLVHAARGEVLTNARARAILGVGVDSTRARAALRRLRDAGLLAQEGDRGGARYRMSDDLGVPTRAFLMPQEIAELLLEMAAEGPLTNADVRRRTGLDRVETLHYLKLLVEMGRVEPRGERRGTHYVLAETD